MAKVDSASQFTPSELKAIQFLAASRIDSSGRKWSIEEFCTEVLQIHFTTFYRWQSRPEFRMAVLDETMARVSKFIPAMVSAQVNKAIKQGDTTAFMAIMRQASIIKADKQEIKQEVNNIDAALE